MPELTATSWTLLAVAALLVGFAKTAIGGVAGISVALFATVLPAKESTGALLPLLLVGDLVAVRTYRAHAHWPTLLRLMPAVVVGVVVGYLFVDRVDDTMMRRTIGAVLLALVAVHLSRRWFVRRRSRAEATAATRRATAGGYGVLAGFTTMVANAGGSVTSLYLLSAGLGVLGFLGTTAWFFLVVNAFKLPFSLDLGLVSTASLAMDAVLVPGRPRRRRPGQGGDPADRPVPFRDRRARGDRAVRSQPAALTFPAAIPPRGTPEMKLGAYTACLHDHSLPDALKVLADLGLDSAEINSGGFLPPVHLPIDDIRASETARQDYLGLFTAAGVELTALNCNGNPLDPHPEVGPKQAQDLLDSIEVAALLGVRRIVTMSGTPAATPGGTRPTWNVLPWHSAYLDVRDHQWGEAVPFWRRVNERAAHFDVTVAIEMHPHNVVYNPATLERLVAETGATHVGAEMDPSHLFWQGIEPIEAVDHLGELVVNAAAKDTRINAAARINGVLDDRFVRVGASEPDALGLGGPYTLSRWPQQASWDFVAVGRGHDVDWWRAFLAALERVDPDMAVNIEHEDVELSQMDGLATAATTLLTAAGRT